MKVISRANELFFLYSVVLLLVVSPILVKCYNENDENEEEEVQRSQFPDGFLFGAGSSAYQALKYLPFFFVFYFLKFWVLN